MPVHVYILTVCIDSSERESGFTMWSVHLFVSFILNYAPPHPNSDFYEMVSRIKYLVLFWNPASAIVQGVMFIFCNVD